MVWIMFVGTLVCALICGLCAQNRRWVGAGVSGLAAIICFALYAYEMMYN